MTKLRIMSLAASLAAVTALTSPALAIDLGGGLGGAAGGAISPSGIGGSITGSVNGTLDATTPRTDRLGRLNDRADRVNDTVQDRSVGAVKVPEQPDAAALDAAMKAAGYGDVALTTPAGSASGSADASADGAMPDTSDAPALPDRVATANGAVDQVQTAKTTAVKRAAAAVPAEPVSASVSGSADVNATTEKSSAESPAETSGDDAASPEAAETTPERPTSATEMNAPQN